MKTLPLPLWKQFSEMETSDVRSEVGTKTRPSPGDRLGALGHIHLIRWHIKATITTLVSPTSIFGRNPSARQIGVMKGK